jgi:predicted short-subunit dehydrogenase-like oxidoreductase (DUF2520 family)
VTERSRLSAGEASFFDAAALPETAAVGLVGAGRVAAAFGRALARTGHPIDGVAASTPAGAASLASDLAARAATVAEVAANADLIVIAVPDDALQQVAAHVASSMRADAWVVHTCGRFGAAPLASCGERVAAVHPAVPITPSTESLDGVAFGVTCPDAAWPFASWLADRLGGFAVRVPEERRALYHAALVVASNFTTALAADAFALAGPEVVLPLLRSTIENIERMPVADALTGPVVRGDAGTIAAHLEAVDVHAPYLRDAYVAVSRRLLAHARASGRLDDTAANAIEDVLDR